MNKLLLISMSDVKTATDGRQYYQAIFQDQSNPFSDARSRMFWSGANAVWTGGNPATIAPLVGKLVLEGEIMTLDVAPYTIGDKTVSSYTCVVFKGELPSKVFKSSGHELASVSATVAPELVEA